MMEALEVVGVEAIGWMVWCLGVCVCVRYVYLGTWGDLTRIIVRSRYLHRYLL